MIPNIGLGEMVLIFLVVLLLFGAKRLPEIGSSLGKGIREFKSSMKDVQRDLKVTEVARTVGPARIESELAAVEAPVRAALPAASAQS